MIELTKEQYDAVIAHIVNEVHAAFPAGEIKQEEDPINYPAYEDLDAALDKACELYADSEESREFLTHEMRRTAKKNMNRRHQLRMYQEKLELMKTWKGIARTIGQKLGVCK